MCKDITKTLKQMLFTVIKLLKGTYTKIKKYLKLGGGIHLLTSFLYQDYDITSIEPGGFTGFADELRNKILNQTKIKTHSTTVEKFTTDIKFDFIFSMNVLEHTDDIK